MTEIVYCTAPSDEVGEALARGLVERRLAACVNLVPGIRSIYRWEGTIQSDAEVLLIVKTTRERRDALVAWLDEAHPYDVPEILSTRVEGGSPAYLRFVEDETRT